MKNILIVLITVVLGNTVIYSQNPDWINYTNGDKINCIEIEGDLVWIGTGGGLVKYDRSSEGTVFYNRSVGNTRHIMSMVSYCKLTPEVM